MAPWHRRVVILASVLLAIAAVVSIPLTGPIVEDFWHRTDFDSEKWRDDGLVESREWPARFTMVDDLLAGHELVGMSRQEVERLLGLADDTAYHRSWDMIYWLGPERGLLRVDSEWLVMRVDDRGLVTEVNIVRD